MGSYLWANYLHSIINNKDQLFIVPDSGFLIPYPAFNVGQDLLSVVVQNMFTLSNLNEATPMDHCTSMQMS